MLSRFRRSISRFFNKSRKINHEPINKASLIVLIIVDLFILANVFAGLDDISRWPISPQQAYPCHSEWQRYRQNELADKDYTLIAGAVRPADIWQEQQYLENQNYAEGARGHLGQVSDVCLQYGGLRDGLSTQDNNAIAQRINDAQAEINSFRNSNATIRQQYDSTLLEEIAGQPREQSINAVEAAAAKREIEQNDRAIAQREDTLEGLKGSLLKAPESQDFLDFLADDAAFSSVDSGHNKASFWHPSIQLLFQGLFLLPLIAIASTLNRFAQRKNYGYIALISWHLLAIFTIPLIWKVFEFLQIGFIFSWLADVIQALFGGLRFLLNYLQILIIPVIGFGIIKFFQKVVFNTRLQAANRVQNRKCVSCGKKIRKYDVHCPHCSYRQYQECNHCHNLTYRHLPHCKHCGESQPLEL
ncbi:MAG: hypothetical protein AAFO06_04700 [Cyanobacteria bacterium J06597_16]